MKITCHNSGSRFIRSGVSVDGKIAQYSFIKVHGGYAVYAEYQTLPPGKQLPEPIDIVPYRKDVAEAIRRAVGCEITA